MMYPRLMLLQKLLADDGVIFISIDDNELYNLKSICDEIFGASCFASDVSWQRTYASRNDTKGISNAVEHILVYSKQPGWNPNRLPRTEEMNAKYGNPDKIFPNGEQITHSLRGRQLIKGWCMQSKILLLGR